MNYREFTYEQIAETFAYDPETGELFRQEPNGKVRAITMTKVDGDGYSSSLPSFRGHRIVCTHICFMLQEHRWPLPRHVIDHRDGDVFMGNGAPKQAVASPSTAFSQIILHLIYAQRKPLCCNGRRFVHNSRLMHSHHRRSLLCRRDHGRTRSGLLMRRGHHLAGLATSLAPIGLSPNLLKPLCFNRQWGFLFGPCPAWCDTMPHRH